jgi:hypothetical protein
MIIEIYPLVDLHRDEKLDDQRGIGAVASGAGTAD